MSWQEIEDDIERYREYMASEDWRTRREEFLAQPDNQWCFDCGVTREQHREFWGCDISVHHVSYRRVGAELDADLQTLCRTCHDFRESKIEKEFNKIVAPRSQPFGRGMYKNGYMEQNVLLCARCGARIPDWEPNTKARIVSLTLTHMRYMVCCNAHGMDLYRAAFQWADKSQLVKNSEYGWEIMENILTVLVGK